MRSLMVYSFILAFLYLVSFQSQVLLSELRFANRNYEQASCNAFKQLPNRSTQRNIAFSAWSEYHIQANDFDGSQLAKQVRTTSYVNGSLSCFCDLETSRQGWLPTAFMDYAYHIKNVESRHNDILLNLMSHGGQPICRQYLVSSFITNYYGILTSTSNFIINLAIMLFAETLIFAIGLHYKTTERVLVNVVLFVCLILNSMLLPLMLQANFSADYPDSLLDHLFSAGGRNSDFNSTWYEDISSQLTLTLIFLSLMPLILVYIEALQLKLTKWILKRKYANHTNNNSDNIKFLELKSGPEYNFATKAASLNCVIFMTISLGTAFPYFYGIALFAIVIQYIVERYSLALFYKLPAKFSLNIS